MKLLLPYLLPGANYGYGATVNYFRHGRGLFLLSGTSSSCAAKYTLTRYLVLIVEREREAGGERERERVRERETEREGDWSTYSAAKTTNI